MYCPSTNCVKSPLLLKGQKLRENIGNQSEESYGKALKSRKILFRRHKCHLRSKIVPILKSALINPADAGK